MNTLNLHNSLDKLLVSMAEAGAMPANGLPDWQLAGQIQRYQVKGEKPGSKNGWINFFLDGQGCVFGNWRLGSKGTFFAGGGKSKMIKAEWSRLEAEVRAATVKEQKERFREGAKQSRKLWISAQEVNPEHPYLQRKLVNPFGLRQRGDLLLVPVFDGDGQLMSLQFIGPDGVKRFKAGACMKSGRMGIGDTSASNIILLCEGWATGATLHEATGYPVVVCFNAGNLMTVASDIRQAYRRHRLIICADNDHRTPGNPGLTKGAAAATQCYGELVNPEFEPYQKGSDFNDFGELWGMEAVAWVIAEAVDERGEGEKL